jgi:predicted patatin/cPLA2 family phospholipase
MEEEKLNIETLKRKLDKLEQSRVDSEMNHSQLIKSAKKKKSLFCKKNVKTSRGKNPNYHQNKDSQYMLMKRKDNEIKKLVKKTRKLKNEYLRELAKDSYQKHFLKKLVAIIDQNLQENVKESIVVNQDKPIGVEEFIKITTQNNQIEETEKTKKFKILKTVLLEFILRGN